MEDSAKISDNSIAPAASATWPIVLMALAAGGATLLLLQTLEPVFQVDEKYNIEGLGAADEKWTAYLAQKRVVDLKNVALFTGFLGAALGVALAFLRPAPLGSGSAASKSGLSAARPLSWRLLGGALLGGICGLLAGIAAAYLQQYFVSQGQPTVVQSVMVQALLFGILGVGLGAVSGGLAGGSRMAGERAGSGLVAGLLAGIAYPILASIFFATANSDTTIPQTWPAQLLWLAVGTGLLGWLISRPTTRRESPRQ